MKKENEVEMYVLHITQNNDMKKLMNKEMADYLKREKIAITPPPSPKFLITLLFSTVEQRKECADHLKNEGIEVAFDLNVAYVDKKYLEENDEVCSESESEDIINA